MFAAIPLIQKLLYGSAVALILALALMWQIEKRSANKWEARAVKLSAELQRISTAKNEQRETTKGNVVKAGKTRVDADRVARRIEAAPLTGQCATPEAVLSADL